MSENLTFLGNIADDFDSELKQAEHILDNYVESSGYSTRSMVTASTTIAFMRFGQSFADVLRIGNGLSTGGWKGIVGDSMRLLTIGGIAGATVSRLSRILVVTQEAGTFTCTWISTLNALQRTGQRFFATIEEMAQSAGVDLTAVAKAGGTAADQCKRLIEALKKMSVPVEEVTPANSSLETMAEVIKQKPNGALAFAIDFEQNGRRLGHQLFATYSRSAGLVITDTTGKLYRGLNALKNVYSDARLLPTHMFLIKNAAIITGAENAATAGGFSGLVLELLPVGIKKQTQKNAARR